MIPAEEIEQELRLPWKLICALAVKAMIARTDVNQIMVQALQAGLQEVRNEQR